MKRTIPILLPFIIVCVLSILPASGQEYFQDMPAQFGVESSPNVVGSGARALGVGGAFIAIADDGTAASWNPAALIILRKPETALMFSYEKRDRNGETSFADFNYIAASYPFSFINRNMIVSFNYQRLVDFNNEFEESFKGLVPGSSTQGEAIFEGIYPGETWETYTLNFIDMEVDNLLLDIDISGDVGALAPAFAIQVTPKVSLGLTLNFWMDGIVNNGYDREYSEKQKGSEQRTKIYWVDVDDDGEIDGEYIDDGDGVLEPF